MLFTFNPCFCIIYTEGVCKFYTKYFLNFMSKKPTVISKALQWWENQVLKQKIVITRSDFPSDYYKTFLVRKGFAGRIKHGLYLLRKPEENLEHQILLSYFKIIKKILSKYTPWAIKGISALEIYLGNQKIPTVLYVRTARKIKYKFKIAKNLMVLIIYDPNFNQNLVKEIEHLGEKIFIDVPERVLLDLKRIGHKEEQFLKSVKFDYRLMEIMYQDKPSPIVFGKLCRILPGLKQQGLAEEMKIIMDRYTFYRSVKIKPSKKFPSKKILEEKPWVLRQSDQISYFAELLEKKLRKTLNRISTYPLKTLLKQAEENKKYDIYHSTTIEGYDITPEDVERVLLSPRIYKKKEKDLRNKMAILGYKDAFEFVLKKVKTDFPETKINDDLIKNIFFNLFRPSVEFKVVEGYSLTRYRNIQNYIRGSRHIPPAPDKIIDLMESMEKSLGQVIHPLVKAILAHFAFVSIHPYMDGNGRTARLLMNYILLSSGYQWVTIKAEDRKKYFDALETAQVDDDIIPFAKLILGFL